MTEPADTRAAVDWNALLAEARAMLPFAYAPYSKFHVGAALIGANGRIYKGANVENASYGLTICAERVAVFHAVSDGCTLFNALAITCSGDAPPYPCGACRQVLHEFAPSISVFCAGRVGNPVETSLDKLLPLAFQL